MASTAPTPLTPKQQAKKLLAKARSAFDAGDYEEARAKALKADEFDVKWDILEDQPQTLLSEIERSTGTKILSRKSVKKQADSNGSDPVRARALELIRQARCRPASRPIRRRPEEGAPSQAVERRLRNV